MILFSVLTETLHKIATKLDDTSLDELEGEAQDEYNEYMRLATEKIDEAIICMESAEKVYKKAKGLK